MNSSRHDDPETSVTTARQRLVRLQVERLEALEAGIEPGSDHLVRLERAIGQAQQEYVVLALCELAMLRAALGDEPIG